MIDWKDRLYFGDNIETLRGHVPDESVDLIYLDPPFNSNVTYNVLFQEANGTASPAQITAFEDTWHWGPEAEGSYVETITGGPQALAGLMRALRTVLGRGDMMTYLAMMAPRLVELRRVLRSTGSVYPHCDPTASHYLKMLMDAIFEAKTCGAEIVWKRYSSHVYRN